MKKHVADVMYFLIWVLVLCATLLLITGRPPFMLGVLTACFTIFVCGNDRVRVLISWVMIIGLVAFTFMIAKFTTTPRDPSNWLISKIMFVAFFGIFGAEIVKGIDWSKDYLARFNLGNWTKNLLVNFSIWGSFGLIFAAYLLKFFFQGEPEAVAFIAKEACQAGAKCIGMLTDNSAPAYGIGDWAEDVLFGLASTWFAVIVPKAVETATALKNASGTNPDQP